MGLYPWILLGLNFVKLCITSTVQDQKTEAPKGSEEY